MESNPYSAPAANLFGATSDGMTNAVSSNSIALLAGTKPWVRFMSVILWLMCALMTFTCGTLAFFVSIGTFDKGPDAAFTKGIMIGTAAYYGVIALVMIYPALKLWKYASCIAKLMTSRTIAELDAALTEQRRYWKFNGVMIIAGLSLGIIGFITLMAVAVLKPEVIPH